MSTEFSVVSPAPPYTGKKISLAPRIPDLNGKTICEVWNGRYRGDVTFPMLRELLKKRYPGVKIIPYTEFPVMEAAVDIDKSCERLKELFTLFHADAVLAGNGG